MNSNIINYTREVTPKLRHKLDELNDSIELNLTSPLLAEALREIELDSLSGFDLISLVNKLYDKKHLISQEGMKTLASAKTKYDKYMSVLEQLMRIEALNGTIIRLIDSWSDVKYIFIDSIMELLNKNSNIDFSKFKFKYNIFVNDINQYNKESYMILYKKIHMSKRKR